MKPSFAMFVFATAMQGALAAPAFAGGSSAQGTTQPAPTPSPSPSPSPTPAATPQTQGYLPGTPSNYNEERQLQQLENGSN